MKQLLETPVEFGETLLAPTTELAGLAKLAHLHTQDERIAALLRIAYTIDAEDRARSVVADGREAARSGLIVLPQRGR